MEYRKPLPKKIEIIQTLRAIACLSVVFLHLWHDRENIIIQKQFNALFKAGGYGVQVFFIISGFILPYSLRDKEYSIHNFFKFMARRLTRLEPVYVASILLALFLSYYLAPKTGISFEIPAKSTKDIWLHFLYLIPFVEGAKWVQNVNWTLAIEFQFYILLGITAPIIMNKSISKYFKHLFLITLLSLGFAIEIYNVLPPWLAFFCAGISTFLYLNLTFSKVDILIQFLFYNITLWCLFSSVNYLLILNLVPILIYTFLNTKNLPFQFLGEISYSIYLTHSLIGIFINNYLKIIMNNSTILTQVFIFTMSFISSIISAYIFYQLFEKPFTKLSKQISL